MRRARLVLALPAALLAIATPARAAGTILVAVDRTQIETKLGHRFAFTSTISNRGSTAATGLIAHLNVLSLRSGAYVDPEDWSSNRTRHLASIPASGSTTITWRLSAVNPGSIGVYVAVLPQARGATPTTGPDVRVEIADRRTLDSGGILPLALGVPALLGAAAVALRLRRAR